MVLLDTVLVALEQKEADVMIESLSAVLLVKNLPR